MTGLSCFKAYDIRGRVPEELDTDMARGIARAYARIQNPKRVVVGRDVRTSSEELSQALCEGFLESGVDVVDIGLCGTEMVYFASFHLEAEGVDGGIMITASHNPKGHNGLKLVARGAVPISGDTGLKDIEKLVAEGVEAAPGGKRGESSERDVMDDYVEHLLGYVDRESLRRPATVVNPGNGCAGPVIDRLEEALSLELHKVNFEPDGEFPNGVPNPLLGENRAPTVEEIRRTRSELGVAWDGDFDRCFFFDDEGGFVEGYYIVGLFAEEMLRQSSSSAKGGARIIHDPRLIWNTLEMVEAAGGRSVMSKAGHAFIKERMRKEDAIYGGEMSAHHYFKNFAYCDSGMIPWLLLMQIMSRTGRSLRELVSDRMAKFPASGEINRRLEDPRGAIARVREKYESRATGIDETDGLSLDFGSWRFNVRMSNTEPVLRLNVESRAAPELMQEKTEELLAVIGD